MIYAAQVVTSIKINPISSESVNLYIKIYNYTAIIKFYKLYCAILIYLIIQWDLIHLITYWILD